MPDTVEMRDSATTQPQPYLLVISQVYVPDPAAVGQYVADGAEEMVRRGWSVGVLAASRGYDDPSTRYAARETRGGVSIRRLPFSSFGKRSIAVRLLAQSIFLAQAFLHGLFGRRPDLVLVSTSPPFAGLVGAMLSLCRGTPYAWWVMDINPDQMVAADKLAAGSPFVRIFDWINRITLRRAATVVTLDRFMAERLRQKGPDAPTVSVIPPWPLAEESLASTGETFRSRHDLTGKFVVMYSGNHAIQHPLDTLLDAAREFAAVPRVVFVFMGGGAGKAAVDKRVADGATNIRSFPAVPLEQLADALCAADLHVVTMGDDMVGIVHPCKVYTAMAVGRPILFFGPERSHVGELITDHQVGWSVRHGDTAAAVEAIRTAAASSTEQLSNMGRRAAEAVSFSLSADQLRSDFCDRITPSGAATACETKP